MRREGASPQLPAGLAGGLCDGRLGGRDSTARLRDAALLDSVIAYAQVGQPDQAFAFYRRLVGDAGARPVIDRLAQQYLDTGDLPAARIVCASASAGACLALTSHPR